MIPIWLCTVLAAVFGLAVGSFLNVVIHRLPRGESVVSPPSRCPRCGNQIRNRHNVPLLGWLVLHGRCYDCGLAISARYPLVEGGTAVVFAGLTAALMAAGLGALVIPALALAAVALTAAMIVVDRQRVPRSVGASGAVALIATMAVLAATYL